MMSESFPTKAYVHVSVDFDDTGRMHPTSILWEDGTHYPIECAYDLRPSYSLRVGGQGDRYTIRIRGKERYLFFEHSPDRYNPALGRWFVEYAQQ